MKLSGVQTDVRILILGSSGSGKTHFGSTLCKLIPDTLVVTSELSGLTTLKTLGVDPEIIYIDDWRRIWDQYDNIVKASKNHRAILIDDLGATQMAARRKVDYMPRGAREEKLSPREMEQQFRKELLLGERPLRIQDWGGIWIAMENFIGEILGLSFQIKLVTCLEAVFTNPRTEQEEITIALSGQAKTTLPARFSLVAETFIANLDGKFHFCLSCLPHPRVETKTRYGVGRLWENPDMAKILAYISGKDEPETELEKKIRERCW